MTDLVTSAETADLRRYETVIERGSRAFIEVGQALLAIRDGKLYRASHDTFEAYCRERWDFNRNFANKTIRAAKTTAALGTTVPILPAREHQVRPLTRLEPATAAAAWERAVENAGGEQPTQRQVEEAVAEIVPPPATPKPPSRRPRTVDGYIRLIGELSTSMLRWKQLPADASYEELDNLRLAISAARAHFDRLDLLADEQLKGME